MKEKVINFIERHDLVEKNKTIIVGVSGGPDSMALLHLLNKLKNSYQLKLIALCIDHQLRGEESAQEVEYVRNMCYKWNIPFISEKIDVLSYKKKHQLSTQMAARELRYHCYEKQMKKQKAHYLALGHHANDQVETMLMAISQVTDPSALSGIPVQRSFSHGKIIRPLLAVTKEDIHNYCQTHSIKPKFDPSNLDDRYRRIYYRQQVVPKIKKQNYNVEKTMQYLSEAVHDDEHYLMSKAEKIFKTNFIEQRSDQKLLFSIKKFLAYPMSLQRRLFRLILDYLYDKLPRSLSYVHEEQFFSLLNEEKSNRQIDFPEKLKVEKSYDNILFHFSGEQKQSYFHKVVDLPSVINLPNGATLSFSYTDEKIYDDNKYVYSCPMKNINLPIHIRTRRPGDRMTWKGLNGSKKIKDVFIDEKIPRFLRDQKLLITDSEQTVLWIVGVKKGLPYKKVTNQKPSHYLKIVYDKGCQ